MNETGTKQPGKLRAFFGRLGGWFKQHKKFAALLVVLALAAAIVLRFLPQKGAAQGGTVSFVRTTTLQKTSLENSVSTTGTVESANVSTVTTDLKYTVKSVNVQVGDTVQAGDVICTLDTEDLEKQIERAKESQTDQTEQTQEAYDKALKSYNKAKKDYDDAVTAVDDAEDDYYDSWDDLNAAVNQVSALQADYDSKQSQLSSMLTEYNEAVSTYGVDSDEAKAAKDRYEQFKEGDAKDAQTALENAQSITGYQSLVQAKDQAVAAWEQAKTAKEQAEKQLETASESLDTAKKNLDKSGSSDTLEDLQEQLTKCTLTAETSGTVTSLNATVGSICSDTVATIQDTNALKIAVTIQEYDVPNVSIGMKARITSDATDGEISGTLTQISPTATAATGGQSSSSSSGTFSAEVSVDGASSGLLIGMNANVEIVQSTTDNVFVVPYDAVGTEDDGTKYVMVKTGGDGADATFEKVTVTTGAENDYYIEISGDALNEGMEVRSSASDDSTETVDASDMMGQGGFVFSAGGDMPSGGGQGGPSGGQGGPGGGQGGGPGGM